jgi:hypothetical protein
MGALPLVPTEHTQIILRLVYAPDLPDGTLGNDGVR